MLSDELGVQTFGDLLEYYPYKHVDRSRLYTIRELTGDMPFVQVKGHILSFETFKMSARKKRVVAHFTDGYGKVMDLTWFNYADSALKKYKIGTEYVVFGRPQVFNGWYIPTWRRPTSWNCRQWVCSPTTTRRRR